MNHAIGESHDAGHPVQRRFRHERRIERKRQSAQEPRVAVGNDLTGYAAVQLRGWRGKFECLDIQPAEIGGEIVYRHRAGHEGEDTLGNDAPRRATHIGPELQRVSVSVQPQLATEHAALRHTRI